jgi:O-antigen/teichoic acid export membrane protein
MLPSVAAASDHARAAERVAQGVRMTAMLAILVCAGVAAAAPVAIPLLFGAGYSAALLAALILVPAAGVLGVNYSLAESIRALGRPYVVLRAELLGLVVTAIALAAMLRPLGILGAALASLLGYFTVTLALLASTKRIAGTSIASLIVPRPAEMRRGMLRLAAAARAIAAPAG